MPNPSAEQVEAALAAEIERIANDFIPDRDADAPQALQEMRDALRTALAARSVPPDIDGTVAVWMIERGYATGHGDTVADILGELEAQIKESALAALPPDIEAQLAEIEALKNRIKATPDATLEAYTGWKVAKYIDEAVSIALASRSDTGLRAGVERLVEQLEISSSLSSYRRYAAGYRDAARELCTLLAQAPGGWRPIDAGAKTSYDVHAYGPRLGQVIVFWDDASPTPGYSWGTLDGPYYPEAGFTHYRTLPIPPEPAP